MFGIRDLGSADEGLALGSLFRSGGGGAVGDLGAVGLFPLHCRDRQFLAPGVVKLRHSHAVRDVLFGIGFGIGFFGFWAS